MHVLVIGGTGFIGPHVVRRLNQLGHDVTIFHRGEHEVDLPTEVRHLHGEWLVGLRDVVRPLRRVGGTGPATIDVVLYMPPDGEPDTREVAHAFKGIAGRLVVISSIDVYRAYGRLHRTEPGPPDPTPLTEDAPLRERLYPHRQEPPRDVTHPERWLDDYDKILVERIALAEPDLPGTVLRLPMVYGPGDLQYRFFSRLKRMVDRRPAILLDEGTARWRGTRGYVENVAAAIALAVVDERARGRIYNVGEPMTRSEANG